MAIHIEPRPTRADSLATLALPLDVLIAEGHLTEIPGVGDAIAAIITKLHGTGSHPSLEKLRKEIPAGVLEMLTVPGLRPEKVLRLYKDLGITSLAELEAAAKEDRIRKTKGLGAALQTKILQNLAVGALDFNLAVWGLMNPGMVSERLTLFNSTKNQLRLNGCSVAWNLSSR